MLTINEQPSNSRKNMKLLLSALASTAIVGGAVSYFVSNKSSSNLGNSKYLEMIPEEFSGEFSVRQHSDYFDGYNYTFDGMFNKWNDENNDWSLEFVGIEKDDLNDNHINRKLYLKDDKFTFEKHLGTSSYAQGCQPAYRNPGYALYKEYVGKAVKADLTTLSESTVARVNNECPEDFEKAIMNSEDYGMIVLCSKRTLDNYEAVAIGREFTAKMKTSPEKWDIEDPVENAFRHSFEPDECRTHNKFQSQKDSYIIKMTKLGRRDEMYELPSVDNFPFINHRKIHRDRQLQNVNYFNSNLGSSWVASAADCIEGEAWDYEQSLCVPAFTTDANEEYNGVFNPDRNFSHENHFRQSGPGEEPTISPSWNTAKCFWVHGAGNAKDGYRRKTGKIYENSYGGMKKQTWDHFSNYTERNLTTGHTNNSMKNGTVHIHWQDHNNGKPAFEGYPNGSSCFYMYKDPHQVTQCKNTFYPFHIIGEGKMRGKGGVNASDCGTGQFWEANSATNNRSYNSIAISNELHKFYCPNGDFEVTGESCAMGYEDINGDGWREPWVINTHSMGGMITMFGIKRRTLVKRYFVKIAMSACPHRGSIGSDVVYWLCDTQNHTTFTQSLIHGSAAKTFNRMGYCRNSCRKDFKGTGNHMYDEKVGYCDSGIRNGSVHLGANEMAYEHNWAWEKENFINYRQCGMAPAGIWADQIITKYGDDWIHDPVKWGAYEQGGAMLYTKKRKMKYNKTALAEEIGLWGFSRDGLSESNGATLPAIGYWSCENWGYCVEVVVDPKQADMYNDRNRGAWKIEHAWGHNFVDRNKYSYISRERHIDGQTVEHKKFENEKTLLTHGGTSEYSIVDTANLGGTSARVVVKDTDNDDPVPLGAYGNWNTDKFIVCHYRGCRIRVDDGYGLNKTVDSDRAYDWKKGYFISASDGIVGIESCLGRSRRSFNPEYRWVDGVWTYMSMDAKDKNGKSLRRWNIDRTKPENQHDMAGSEAIMYTYTNHEDNCGMNGNGWGYMTNPVDFYTAAINSVFYNRAVRNNFGQHSEDCGNSGYCAEFKLNGETKKSFWGNYDHDVMGGLITSSGDKTGKVSINTSSS